MYREAETALIGMDRFDSALQVDGTARKLGVSDHRNLLVATYLGGRGDMAAKDEDRLKAALFGGASDGQDVSLAAIDGYARYLDSNGRLAEGLDVWRAGAERARAAVGLDSAAASMIARATLDHAIAEDCEPALTLAEEAKKMVKGPVATFDAAVGAALCGDLPYSEKAVAELRERFPQNTAVEGYYVPEIEAAGLIGANHPGDALTKLSGVEQFDQVSMGPYLRGLAHEALGQSAQAEEDFQLVLKRRGWSMGMAGSMYAMAQFEIARVYAATGDSTDSSEIYKRFAEMWVKADKAPQLKEAVLRSR
jgi:serine/threonine-protein kinase